MLKGWKRVVTGCVLVVVLAGTGVYLISIEHAGEGGSVLGLISGVVMWLTRGRIPGLPALGE